MLRPIAVVMIFILSCTYAAWAMDVHFVSFTDHAISQSDIDFSGVDTAVDPDHCSHGGAHLSGMVESCGLTTTAAVVVPKVREAGYSSFLGSPPADPPKA